jgi:hypothetical protein
MPTTTSRIDTISLVCVATKDQDKAVDFVCHERNNEEDVEGRLH